MEIDSGLLEVHGAKEVVEWFGRWPNFHDAEVVSVFLDRGAESKIRIHALYGSIKAEQVRLELEPGIPDGSMYGPRGTYST